MWSLPELTEAPRGTSDYRLSGSSVVLGGPHEVDLKGDVLLRLSSRYTPYQNQEELLVLLRVQETKMTSLGSAEKLPYQLTK